MVVVFYKSKRKENIMIVKSEYDNPDGIEYCYYDDSANFSGSFLIMNFNEIWDLEIFPEYRNKGYCQKMLREFLDLHFFENVVLYVEDCNPVAYHVYNKIGFQFVEIGEEVAGIRLIKMEYKEN